MLTINKKRAHITIDFAASEMKKYLRMMMPESGAVEINLAPDASNGFRLGLMEDFGLDTSSVESQELDDLIYIDTDEDGGIIAGNNPRSVLLAVYEFFRQNGCRWIMPGVDGEYIPLHDIKPVKYSHAPSCRYRGWGTSTAQFQPSMLEMIDFTPKVGMNLCMIEFTIPHAYYNSYYSHAYNRKNRPPETVTAETVLQWKRACECEMEIRGLQFHDVGHGFVVDAFGELPSGTSHEVAKIKRLTDKVIPEKNFSFLAKLNGERKLFNDLSVYTQFCMSNPEGRKRFTDSVADYAELHTNVDFLHVWLADGSFNHCECDECVKQTPCDWYIQLMNEIDNELTKRNLKTRIVFIAYTDTMWPPRVKRIINPDRFTLCFAPITRTYSRTHTASTLPKVTEFVLNKSVRATDLDEHLSYLEEWKKIWGGSVVGFEYHSWSAHVYDLSGLAIAERVNEDIKEYKKFGVNGLIEDGSQRHFTPHGLVVYSYARTMFDCSLSYGEIAKEYFKAAFGEEWEEYFKLLNEIRKAVPYEYASRTDANRRASKFYDPRLENDILSVKETVKKLREIISRNYISPIRVQTVSVRLLELHLDMIEIIAEAYAKKCVGDDDAALALYEKARDEIGKKEAGLELYYDHYHYMSTFKYCFDSKTDEKQKNSITEQMYKD